MSVGGESAKSLVVELREQAVEKAEEEQRRTRQPSEEVQRRAVEKAEEETQLSAARGASASRCR